VDVKLAAAKIIFYGYMSLQSHENVEFVTNSPTKHQTFIDTEKLHLPVRSSNYNIIENGSEYDFIFRSRWWSDGGSTCLYNKKRGITNNILRDTYFLSHNFCTIKPKCGTYYYGIGGEHTNAYRTFCRRFKVKIEEEPTIHHAGTDIVTPKIWSKYHHNGLYLMKSPDLIHWEYVKRKPVISGIHPGHTDKYWGFSKFDSKISCFYSHRLQQYLLFLRANMGPGRRWIQTSRSKDLIHWEPFQLLEMDGVDFDNDNYYSLDAMEYPDANVFVGLSAYTNKPKNPTDVCIKAMFSKDGVRWIDSGSILNTPASFDGIRNSTQTTSVFFDRGTYYDIFFNENYDGVLDFTKSATVVNYRIPKDRLVGVKSKSTDVAKLSFSMNVRSDTVLLNYDCGDNGYIKFSIGNDDERVLVGNHLNKKVVVDSRYIDHDVRINVEMKNCTLYSCSS